MADSEVPGVAFAFGGAGAIDFAPLRVLYATQPVFRKSIESCREILHGALDRPLLESMWEATDQPLLIPDTVTSMLQLHGAAVVPIADGTRQVLCAVYRDTCLEPLEALLATDPAPSLQRLLDDLPFRTVLEAEWRGWGEDGRSWRSIDTPDELAALQAGR